MEKMQVAQALSRMAGKVSRFTDHPDLQIREEARAIVDDLQTLSVELQLWPVNDQLFEDMELHLRASLQPLVAAASAANAVLSAIRRWDRKAVEEAGEPQDGPRAESEAA